MAAQLRIPRHRSRTEDLESSSLRVHLGLAWWKINPMPQWARQDYITGIQVSGTHTQYSISNVMHIGEGLNEQIRKMEDFQIYHIPTLLNGKVGNKSMKRVSCEVTYVNSITKNKLRRYKVTMIGDSFVGGIRENVELSLSNKFDIYSMVKPGCELNTLLESANSVLRSLTQRDIILICGG